MADPISLLVMERARAIMATIDGVDEALLSPPMHGEHRAGRAWIYDGLDEFDHAASPQVQVDAKLACAVQFNFDKDPLSDNSLIRRAHRWQADIIRTMCGVKEWDGPSFWCTVAAAHRFHIAVDDVEPLGMTTVVFNLTYDFNYLQPYSVDVL